MGGWRMGRAGDWVVGGRWVGLPETRAVTIKLTNLITKANGNEQQLCMRGNNEVIWVGGGMNAWVMGSEDVRRTGMQGQTSGADAADRQSMSKQGNPPLAAQHFDPALPTNRTGPNPPHHLATSASVTSTCDLHLPSSRNPPSAFGKVLLSCSTRRTRHAQGLTLSSSIQTGLGRHLQETGT